MKTPSEAPMPDDTFAQPVRSPLPCVPQSHAIGWHLAKYADEIAEDELIERLFTGHVDLGVVTDLVDQVAFQLSGGACPPATATLGKVSVFQHVGFDLVTVDVDGLDDLCKRL